MRAPRASTFRRWGPAFLLALALAVTVAVYTLQELERAHQMRLEQTLETVSTTSRAAVYSWRDRHLELVSRWAETPAVRDEALALLETWRTPRSLRASPAQRRLRQHLRDPLQAGGYHGMFVIARDGTNVGSMRDATLGAETLLADQREVLDRVWRGWTAMSLPQETDVPLEPGARSDAPTMFALAPIRHEGVVVAALAFRIAPGDDLTSQLEGAGLGATGETYLVDGNGRLMTRSRFEGALREQERLDLGQSSIVHITAREPESGAFTLPVRELRLGRDGSSVEPYTGYLGRPTVGVWHDMPSLGLGIVTEQSAAEAYAPVEAARDVTLAAFALVLAAGFGFAFLQWRYSRRLARSYAELELRRAEEKQTRKLAQASARALREAQRVARMGSGYADLAEGTVTWSESAVALLGAGLPVTVVGLQGLVTRFVDGDRHRVAAAIDRALSDEEDASLRASLVHGDGARAVQLRVRSVRESGHLGGPSWMTLTLQDVGDIVDTEAAVAALNERVHKAERAEALGHLAGGIAHDFNNLLTVMLSCADELETSLPEDSELRESARITREAAAKAAELTGQMLRLTRGDDGDPMGTRLNEALEALARLLDRALGERVALELALDPDAGMVRLPPSDVDQVVMNLVLNARDAMPGGGRIRIETQVIGENGEPGWTELRVDDDGVGMEDEVVRLAFDRNFTTKPPGQGTGLGLATVDDIVTRAGGSIELHSAPGRGTSFRIRLPREGAVGTDPAGVRSPRPVVVGERRVLLVEDEASLRVLFERMLAHRGYEVYPMASAEDALRWFGENAIELPVDVLVSDVVLPGKSGAALARTLRHAQPDLAVVLISGYARGELADSPLGEERVTFLHKPFTATQLLTAVEDVLDLPAETPRSSRTNS